MNQYQKGFLLVTLALLSLVTPLACAAQVPMAPAVYTGDHGQAAIVLDNRSTTPTGLSPGLCPSRIVQACFDGDAGIYFVAEPAPLRLYHWSMGDVAITLVAVQDVLSTDVKAMMQSLQDAAAPLAGETPRYLLQNGGLWEAETMRPVCTPPFESITQWIELPGGMLAVVSPTEGISVVNASLKPGHRLAIDPGLRASESLLRGFAMANPDIRVERVAALTSTRDEAPMDGPATLLPDVLQSKPGVADVYFVPVEEARSAARANCLMDLSASEALRTAARSFYPCVRDAVYDGQALMAMPGLLEPRMWATYDDCLTQLGRGAIPKTLDNLVSLMLAQNGIGLDSTPATPDQVLGLWMVEQYIIQYASETTPLDFDTPPFRKLLKALAALGAAPQADADDSRLLYVERTRAHDLPNGSVPFLPPAFEQDQECKTFADMYVWCADARAANAAEALRFMAFAARCVDPVYACYLSPCEYAPIPAPLTAAQQAIAETAYRQALASNLENAQAVRLTLAQSLQALRQSPPLLSRPVFDFYHQAVVPRLRFLLGGMYMSMDWAYGSDNSPFGAVDGVISGESTVDEAIRLLNRQAAQEYALWH